MLAAEALSKSKAYPEHAVPVLQTVLDVALENDLIEKGKDWLTVALGALGNYEEHAVVAEESAWPYIYAQDNLEFKLRTMTFLSKESNHRSDARQCLGKAEVSNGATGI